MAKKNRVKGSKLRKYTLENFKLAVQAVRKRKLSFGQAQKLYNVPKATLYKYRGDATPDFRSMGFQSRLTVSQEESLAAYMRWCEDHDIPLTYELLGTFAQQIMKLTDSDAASVSHSWMQRFARRYNFSPRKPRHVERARAVAAASPTLIIEYFTLLTNKINQLNLTSKPECIWNCDEKGWSKQQALQRPVLVTKGKTQAKVKQIYTNDHITTLHCINAGGDVMEQVYVIFSRNLPSMLQSNTLPPDWHFGHTESGYINSDLFFLWFRDIFIPAIGRDRPQLLVYDAASSHLSIPLIELAISQNISIISLPGKTTSFLQPVDQILSNLVTSFSSIAYKMSFTKLDFLVRPSNFPPVLKQAIKAAWNKELVKAAFERTGMFPPSLHKIRDSHHLTNECKATLTRFLETGSVDNPGCATELEPPVAEQEAQAITPETLLCAECGRPEDKPCQQCIKREMQRTNVLFKAGLIEEDLATVLHPQEIPSSGSGRKNCLTKAKDVTGKEIIEAMKAKEQEKQKKEEARAARDQARRQRSNPHKQGDQNDLHLPDIHCPSKRRKRFKTPFKPPARQRCLESDMNNLLMELDTDQCPETSAKSNSNHIAATQSSSSIDFGKGKTPRRKSERQKAAINYATLHQGQIEPQSKEINSVKCPICKNDSNPEDEILGIEWYGCDICPQWYHRDCLPADTRAIADLSIIDKSQNFCCPSCNPDKICSVCMVSGTSGYISCGNCHKYLHFDCLPSNYQAEYLHYQTINKSWFCFQCETEQ